MKVYNGEGLILGRLAAEVAKQALLGEEVRVVNCEKIVITGLLNSIVAREKHRRERKGHPPKSSRISRLPDRMMRRTVRGMVPWKQSRGREAFKRVMCHKGIPAEFGKEKLLTVETASIKKLPYLRYATLGQVSKLMGQKPRVQL